MYDSMQDNWFWNNTFIYNIYTSTPITYGTKSKEKHVVNMYTQFRANLAFLVIEISFF
jgi:hypothetical protein